MIVQMAYFELLAQETLIDRMQEFLRKGFHYIPREEASFS